ncbi:MAG: alpha/beta hydrolase [Clostridia bacterium]|nr:alpha/beta hydrolase [Clostridia bacterium]
MVSWIWIPVSILLFCAAVLLVIGWQVVTFALARSASRAMAYQGLDLDKYQPAGNPDDPVEWAAAHAAADWTQPSDAGLLRAWHFPAAAESDRWAVLVHGYTGSAEMSFPWAKRFHELGFHVLAVDCRAHGRSEGRYIGMGWPDRRDLVGWTRMIAGRQPGARIVLYGVSMGAATVMMASGERDLAPGVACVVEDCGFTSVYREFGHRGRRMFHIPTLPILLPASLACLVRCGWSIIGASAVRQIRRHRLPMMFIHGQEDDYVPFGMVHRLYGAARGPKELCTVPGAGHGLSSSVDPQYWDKVFTFIGRHVPDRMPAA